MPARQRRDPAGLSEEILQALGGTSAIQELQRNLGSNLSFNLHVNLVFEQ